MIHDGATDQVRSSSEPELAGIGNGLERPTPRPMQSVPEKPQPMRMDMDAPEGGVTPAPRGRGRAPETSEPHVQTPTHTPETHPDP